MKILYTTDLHGHKCKYKQLTNIFKEDEDKFDIFILGADIFPKHIGDIFTEQEKFIVDFLPNFFKEINIPIIIDMGNDDLKCHQHLFNEVVSDADSVYSSHMNEIVIGDTSFIGCHYVPDYPFGLKDHVRRDGKRISDPFQLGNPVISKHGGFERVPDLDEYLISKKSIREELESLPHPTKKKFVFIGHAPPRGIKLDVCMDYRQVGSLDITNFITDKKPICGCFGHIHESFYKTNIFWSKLNETICIQPGQSGALGNFVFCTFDLDNIEETIERREI